MEDAFFTVEQAAGFLDCKRSTVYELIREGWLSRPAGKTKKETGGRVTQKSLFQFMVVDRLSRLPLRVLKTLKKSEFLSSFASKNAEANWYSSIEGIDGTKRTDGTNGTDAEYQIRESLESSSPSATLCLKQDNPVERKRRLHHDFAEQHQFSFGWRAMQLAPGDPAMQDDLVQEMSLAVLEYDKPASFDFLFERATSRAKNYLKYEARRGMLSLSEVRHMSDKSADKMASLHDFIDSLMQRGVPAAWIEEVIGERLDVA